ncbi:M15 family metallopeptidase [Lewinella sp. 4G2]|uniref:M15 family metallopeptidase n=1 Tax=Lewinella sp. 4G2 TaxID=1803372 RepID=UPI0007B492E7|nr:M15 family metallopeptidase [Lewinella sp. 4G2]OAV42718.1 peptidase M15 [Lewinella sp. 4G2]
MRYVSLAVFLFATACASTPDQPGGAAAGAGEVGQASTNSTVNRGAKPSAEELTDSQGTDTIKVAEPHPNGSPGIPSYDYLSGKFDPAKHPEFLKVAAKYTDGDPYLLHRETYAAFEKMHAAAKADGITLTIVSATRNFDRQKAIWEAKWNGQRLLEGKDKANEVYPDPADRARAILRFSSMPGTSRHHWGTDIDINRLTNDYFRSGQGLKEYEWLVANGPEFGFCQPYTPLGKARPTGYQEERWHWSYIPLAKRLTGFARQRMQAKEVSGFDGQQAAVPLNVIENYVLGINRDCL